MDNIKRTKKELDLGLKIFVTEMLRLRKIGRIKEYRAVKNGIDVMIKDLKLDSDTVYFCYGDPDNFNQKLETYERARNKEMLY